MKLLKTHVKQGVVALAMTVEEALDLLSGLNCTISESYPEQKGITQVKRLEKELRKLIHRCTGHKGIGYN